MYWNRVYRVSRDLTILLRGKNQFVVATPLDAKQTAEMDAPSLEVLSYFMEPCTPQAAFDYFREKLGISESEFENGLDVMVENKLMELANTEETPPESDIFSLDERPDLIEQAKQSAPELVRRLFDKVRLQLADGSLARDKSVFDLFPAFQSVQWEATRIVAHITSIPIQWECPLEALPDDGFDWAVERSIQDLVDGKSPTMVVGLNIDLSADQLGTGQSYRMVEQMRTVALRHSLRGVILPVRPTMKSAYPLVPMERYVGWKREDGFPLDPWLRVHVRMGARVIKVCSRSMINKAPISVFEEQTGLKFPESGSYPLPNHLAPVKIDREGGYGVYVEPNVWVFHPVSAE